MVHFRQATRNKDEVSSIVSSRLLTELFAGYAQDQPITVLDFGPGSPATLQFLSQFRSKVFFIDVLDSLDAQHHVSPVTRTDPAENSAGDDQDSAKPKFGELLAGWHKLLNLPENSRLDICLFWDYLHFLDKENLEALSMALQPHIDRGTRGYGFGSLRNGVKLVSHLYGISDIEHLAIAMADLPEPPFAHATQTLSEHLHCFKVARGTLLQEGRLELLFEAY